MGFTGSRRWLGACEMDGAIQTDSITVKDSSGARVRLGNNSMAVVENSVQWRIRQAAATKLYLDYRSFEDPDHLVLKTVPVRSE